jgi:hypothetical protein
MTEVPVATAEAALQQLVTHFMHWRQQRATPRGSRIPDALWAEAVRLTQVLPLTQVAKQLTLKPAALRRHAGVPSVPHLPQPRRPPAFVEVTARAEPPPTTEVEVHRPDGTRLRISYSEASPALAPLLQTFLEHR